MAKVRFAVIPPGRNDEILNSILSAHLYRRFQFIGFKETFLVFFKSDCMEFFNFNFKEFFNFNFNFNFDLKGLLSLLFFLSIKFQEYLHFCISISGYRFLVGDSNRLYQFCHYF